MSASGEVESTAAAVAAGTFATGPLPLGHVQLYDRFLPGLAAGSYQVTARQAIGGVDTGEYFLPTAQAFTVTGPRFSLAPGDLGEVYPPADSNGDYGGALPSVVLNRRALPWERGLTTDPAVPWMALLTFQADEVVQDPATGLPLRTSTVADLLTRPGPDVVVPAIDRTKIPADVLMSTVTSVVVPLTVFTAVAPSLAELPLLAHVRRTDTAYQAESAAAQDGWYSVVLGNRFPDTTVTADGGGSRNLCCLVSLEGLTAYLPGGSGGGPIISTQAPSVRLAVLASWSFVANPVGGESFAGLMGGLVAEANAAGATVAGGAVPRIPVPAGAAASPAATRLAAGYVPLSYRTGSGEDTFAWYRGPCAASVPQPLPAPVGGVGHYATSAEVSIYVQDQAVFDLSYAVAFEAGRLAALADRGFAVALVSVRRSAYRALGRVGTRLASGLFGDVPATELTMPRPATRRFGSLLRDGMGTELTQAVADAAQTPQPSRRPVQDTRGGDTRDGDMRGVVERGGQARGEPGAPAVAVRPGPTAYDPVARTRALLAREDVRTLVATHVEPVMDPVTGWLAQLALLHQVPFRHLVPDERMLPVESVRFFYLDASWIGALVDGALSVGVEGSRDLELHQALSTPLVATVAAKVGAVRAERRDRPDLAAETGGPAVVVGGAATAVGFATVPGADAAAAGEASHPTAGPAAAAGAGADAEAATAAGAAATLRVGLLLRSAAVAGWPGMVVQADGGAIPLLRLDRLSDTVLLAIFDGVPQTVTFGEPWHGPRFGLADGNVIHLRKVDGTSLGAQFPAAGHGDVPGTYVRATPDGVGRRVLSVGALAAALYDALGPAERQRAPLGPALFATELVQAPQMLTFTATAGAAPLLPDGTPDTSSTERQ